MGGAPRKRLRRPCGRRAPTACWPSRVTSPRYKPRSRTLARGPGPRRPRRWPLIGPTVTPPSMAAMAASRPGIAECDRRPGDSGLREHPEALARSAQSDRNGSLRRIGTPRTTQTRHFISRGPPGRPDPAGPPSERTLCTGSWTWRSGRTHVGSTTAHGPHAPAPEYPHTVGQENQRLKAGRNLACREEILGF